MVQIVWLITMGLPSAHEIVTMTPGVSTVLPGWVEHGGTNIVAIPTLMESTPIILQKMELLQAHTTDSRGMMGPAGRIPTTLRLQ